MARVEHPPSANTRSLAANFFGRRSVMIDRIRAKAGWV